MPAINQGPSCTICLTFELRGPPKQGPLERGVGPQCANSDMLVCSLTTITRSLHLATTASPRRSCALPGIGLFKKPASN